MIWLKMGGAKFGPMSSFTWNSDPKRLLFVLSRYKFAAKILEGCNSVIEVGCGDGFAARIVRQHVSSLVITDIDPIMVKYAEQTQSADFSVTVRQHNFSDGPIDNKGDGFDGAYLLDVLEHIPHDVEKLFLENLKKSLLKNAKVVIGMPSIESQQYASAGSKLGHVNCKTQESLREVLTPIFGSVSCFSMNDEVVHTGFSRMANYIFAVCTV
jgi:2-polyprenyl-3-methyl-5-hydroxy-6-metoxy-1,4-benzoquinol methylase